MPECRRRPCPLRLPDGAVVRSLLPPVGVPPGTAPPAGERPARDPTPRRVGHRGSVRPPCPRTRLQRPPPRGTLPASAQFPRGSRAAAGRPSLPIPRPKPGEIRPFVTRLPQPVRHERRPSRWRTACSNPCPRGRPPPVAPGLRRFSGGVRRGRGPVERRRPAPPSHWRRRRCGRCRPGVGGGGVRVRRRVPTAPAPLPRWPRDGPALPPARSSLPLLRSAAWSAVRTWRYSAADDETRRFGERHLHPPGAEVGLREGEPGVQHLRRERRRPAATGGAACPRVQRRRSQRSRAREAAASSAAVPLAAALPSALSRNRRRRSSCSLSRSHCARSASSTAARRVRTLAASSSRPLARSAAWSAVRTAA